MARLKVGARRREDNEVEFARIVAFSDGVFAIAITLLVLNLEIPKDLTDGEVGAALWDLREEFLAFAVSFAVIGRFWVLHHRFFGEVSGFDGRLLALNLIYLLWIVLVPFSSDLLGRYGDASPAVAFYAVNLAATVLVGMWMTLYAERAGLVVEERRVDPTQAHLRSLYIAAIFVISIPVAIVSPAIAPLIWLALFFDAPLGRLGRSIGGR